VYVDGTLIKETTGASADMLNRDFPLYIGHLPGFSNTQLYGMVDNLRIWNIERSQAETARCFALLDRELARRSHLSGDALTVADMAVAPFVHRWLALPIEHPTLPALDAYYRRMMMRPAFRQHVALPLS